MDSFGLLPSRIGIALGWGGEYLDGGHWRFAVDYHTCICGVIGGVYTAIGCALISNYGLNTVEWLRKFILWYMVYIALTWLPAYEIGSYALDIWFAPILWLGELELFHWIQNKLKKSIAGPGF